MKLRSLCEVFRMRYSAQMTVTLLLKVRPHRG